MEEVHLDPYQLAKRWRMSTRTLEKWRGQGIGPKFVKISHRIMYRLADVEAFEAERSCKQTGEVASLKEQPPKFGRKPRKPVA